MTGILGVSNFMLHMLLYKKINFDKFMKFCKKLKGKNKDNFNLKLINKYHEKCVYYWFKFWVWFIVKIVNFQIKNILYLEYQKILKITQIMLEK